MRARLIGIGLLLNLLIAGEAHAVVLYRVTGLTDVTFPTWNIGDGALTSSMDLCINTTLLGPYSVTITSAGGYVLSSGANTIPYTLKWNDAGAGNLSGSGGAALTNGVALSNRQNPNSSLLSTDCSTGSPTGPTARLTVGITQAAMTSALAGTYTGTIVLLIGP